VTRAAPKTVLLTGASSGIGRALALEYARRGSHVMAVARRETELDALCDEIASGGGKASRLVCDVADAQAAHDVIARAEKELGSLDMVIANAGVGGTKHATRLDLESATKMIAVNVTGAIATLIAAIPIMLHQKSGHLVGVTSLAGRRALPSGALYSASKAALSTFLEGIRMDLQEARIFVTDVQPGFVDTPMTKKNKHPMPFMWDAPKAARYIADQLESAPGLVAFPLPLRFLTRLSQVLPFGVYSTITKRSSGR
jgi:NADP-dependent 3-hydroxy acid dehydrogenase YdfG